MIGAVGTGVASAFSFIFGSNQHTTAVWILSGVAGAFGGVLPSPFFAILLLHELSCFKRPWTRPIHAMGIQGRNQRSNSSQNFEYNLLEQGIIVTIAAIVASRVHSIVLPMLPYPPTKGATHDKHHVLLGTTDEFSYWQWIIAILLGGLCGIFVLLVLLLTSLFRSVRIKTCHFLANRNVQVLSQSPSQTSPRWLPTWFGALLFPTLAGLVHGCLAVLCPCIVGTNLDLIIRCTFNHQQQNQTFFDDSNPCNNFLQVFQYRNGDDDDENNSSSNNNNASPWPFLWMTLIKSFSVSISIGFGLVGGWYLPMAFMGGCFGLFVAHLLPLLLELLHGMEFWIRICPTSMVVSCCMAACLGGIGYLIPLTILFYMAYIFHIQTVPSITTIWIAMIVAKMVVGRFDLLPSWLEPSSNQDPNDSTTHHHDRHRHHDDPEHYQHDNNIIENDNDNENNLQEGRQNDDMDDPWMESSALPSDSDIVREIQSAIFRSSLDTN